MSVNFDRAVPYYDATRTFDPGVAAHARRLMMQAGDLTAESRVLELGIGTGRMALLLAPHVAAYAGVDISRGMMGALRAKPGGERPLLAEGSVTQLPLPAAHFDAIVEVHVLHLVAGWQAALAEAARTLKPGGVLLAARGGRARLWVGTLFEDELAQFPRRTVGVRGEARREAMMGLGWRWVETHTYTFPGTSTPREMLDGLEGRLWSSLWLMEDEVFAAYAARARALITERFPDLDAPQPTQGEFKVEVWAPPAS